MATILYLLMLLVAVPANAAPSGSSDLLDGIDDFLAAFDGFALPGDPLAEAEQEEPTTEPVTEPVVVTEVAPCLGCTQSIAVDSAAVQETAELAVNLLEENLNSSAVLAVIQVNGATRTVVNGFLYDLFLEVAETNCSWEEPLSVQESCVPAEDVEGRHFHLTLLLQPHRDHSELTYVKELDSMPTVFGISESKLIELVDGSEPLSNPSAADTPQSPPDGAFPGANSEVSPVLSESDREEASPEEPAASEPDLSDVFGIL